MLAGSDHPALRHHQPQVCHTASLPVYVQPWNAHQLANQSPVKDLVANTSSGKPILLFQCKSGPVRATVHGPEIGFRWTRTSYFCWMRSTKTPGEWEQRQPDREQDQIHVKKCNQLVLEWFKQR
ncbi:hypothetical protein CEE69_01265 [Rhodopirellula bahusiensis]|uniref:Uncharacterized protein n=1 Tax=Rhodopirellula bahusiensis TaxID=2014065 RepID=A0A2G1WEC1_9BACT|nr:hypothetical protein CEE69_01265 [Rhodopirellula bahusiensis]